jgi:hypothetical protein
MLGRAPNGVDCMHASVRIIPPLGWWQQTFDWPARLCMQSHSADAGSLFKLLLHALGQWSNSSK